MTRIDRERSLLKSVQNVQAVQAFKPPPLSSPATRGKMQEGVERLEQFEPIELNARLVLAARLSIHLVPESCSLMI